MALSKYKELIKENEKLSEQLAQKEDECAKEGLSWDEMFEKTKDLRVKLTLNDRNARLIQDPVMQFGKNWNGEFIPIEKFVKMCEDGLFNDNDGIGRYATETGVSDVYIYPSDILDNLYRKDFSRVLWLNK